MHSVEPAAPPTKKSKRQGTCVSMRLHLIQLVKAGQITQIEAAARAGVSKAAVSNWLTRSKARAERGDKMAEEKAVRNPGQKRVRPAKYELVERPVLEFITKQPKHLPLSWHKVQRKTHSREGRWESALSSVR